MIVDYGVCSWLFTVDILGWLFVLVSFASGLLTDCLDFSRFDCVVICVTFCCVLVCIRV